MLATRFAVVCIYLPSQARLAVSEKRAQLQDLPCHDLDCRLPPGWT